MNRTVDQLDDSLVGIRGSTITTGLVDTVRVEYYGQSTPISQLAQTSKISNGINITPYDISILGSINQALKKANFSSYIFSKNSIIVSVPPMSGEQKQEIVKRLRLLGEDAKISIRNLRKKYRQNLTKEELKENDKELNKLTDKFILEIDKVIETRITKL